MWEIKAKNRVLTILHDGRCSIFDLTSKHTSVFEDQIASLPKGKIHFLTGYYDDITKEFRVRIAYEGFLSGIEFGCYRMSFTEIPEEQRNEWWQDMPARIYLGGIAARNKE